jgi:hypothetical protein
MLGTLFFGFRVFVYEWILQEKPFLFALMSSAVGLVLFVVCFCLWVAFDTWIHTRSLSVKPEKISKKKKKPEKPNATGLIKVKVIGGLGFTGYVKAWGELYLTIQGTGETVIPKIRYTADGVKLNCWWLIINLTIIEVDTGNTVMSVADVIPHGTNTVTVVGSEIYLSSAKEYLFWLYVEARASININANQVIDYYHDGMGYMIQRGKGEDI